VVQIYNIWIARLHLLAQITPRQSSPAGFACLRRWLAKAKKNPVGTDRIF